MAGNALEIVLKAKNLMGQGLEKASDSLKKFGSSALKIGKAVATAFAAAGAAVLAFSAKAVSAYAVQEAAEKKLSSALRANGENVDALMPKYKALAAAIQDSTGIADEATLAMMGQMSTLGVTAEKMEEAVKAQIAFTQAGMGAEQATRAAALAVQGNYDMLKRYIPALRTATDEGEQQSITQDLIRRGFQQQEDQLKTTSGAWEALKGRIGDAWEAAGEAIVKNTSLADVLTKLGDKVKDLTARFSEWAKSGGIEKIIRDVKDFGDVAGGNVEKAKIIFNAFFDWIGTFAYKAFDEVRVAAINAFNAAGTAIENTWYNVGAVFENTLNKIKGIDDRVELRGLLEGAKDIQSSFAQMPDSFQEAKKKIEEIDNRTAEKVNENHKQYISDLEERKKKENEAAANAENFNDQLIQGLEARESRLEAEAKALKEAADAQSNYGENMEQLAKVIEKIGSKGTVEDFIFAVKKLQMSLNGVDLDLSGLEDLKNLSDIDLSAMSLSEVNKYVKAVRALEQGLKGVGEINVPQGLRFLDEIELGDVSDGDARKFIRAIKTLEQGLKGVKLPDIGAGLGLDMATAEAIAKMAEGLGKLDGKKIDFGFTEEITTAIKNTATNTKAIANDLQDALKMS